MWKLPWPQCSLAEPGSQHHQHLLDLRFPLNAGLKIRTLRSPLLSLAKRCKSAWRVEEIPRGDAVERSGGSSSPDLERTNLTNLSVLFPSLRQSLSQTFRRRREFWDFGEWIVRMFIDPWIVFTAEGFGRVNGAPGSIASSTNKTQTNHKHPKTV